MKIKFIIGVLVLALVSGTAFAQDQTRGEIRLFQNFFEDAYITPDLYIDTEFRYRYFDESIFLTGIPPADQSIDAYNFTFRLGLPLGPRTEIHTRIGAVYIDPDVASSETSISDLYVGARQMVIDQATKVALGGFITVPTGKEEALEDNFDVGVYGAFRHPLEWGIVATGTVGLVYTERPRWFDDHETILRLSGGAIYPHTENLHFVAEAVFESRYDYMLFSGGLDYRLDQKSHLRGSLGFGVDNGAPDILATLAYFFIF